MNLMRRNPINTGASSVLDRRLTSSFDTSAQRAGWILPYSAPSCSRADRGRDVGFRLRLCSSGSGSCARAIPEVRVLS